MSDETTKRGNADLAVLFMEELLGSVETVSGIAEGMGVQTLANVLYLQHAILTGQHIEEYPRNSHVYALVASLPSGETWKQYVHMIDEEAMIPLSGANMRLMSDAEFCKVCGKITRNETEAGYECKACVAERSDQHEQAAL
jgi:hypothetical protein